MVVCGRCGRTSHIHWVFNVLAFCRLVFKGMGISRPDAVIGKCRMIRHSRDRKNEPNPERCVSLCPTAGLGVPPTLPAPTVWLSLCQPQRSSVERLQHLLPDWALCSCSLSCHLPLASLLQTFSPALHYGKKASPLFFLFLQCRKLDSMQLFPACCWGINICSKCRAGKGPLWFKSLAAAS